MLKLLRESEVAPAFKKLRKAGGEALIAVPFWGSGACKQLGVNKGGEVRIVCNLDSGACNPHVVEELVAALGALAVRTHPQLHAKIYLAGAQAIVGSSNASANGLGWEGSAAKCWIEANALSDDVEFVESARDLFTSIWEEAVDAKPRLKGAKERWKNRPPPVRPILQSRLFDACRANPDQFASVYVATYTEGLGKEASKALKAVRNGAGAAQGAALMSDVSENNFRSAWGYQFEDIVPEGAWLIDLSCKNMAKPKVWGSSRVTGLRAIVGGESDLTITLRGPIALPGAAKPFTISKLEKAALMQNASRLLKLSENMLVPLVEAVALVDRRRMSP